MLSTLNRFCIYKAKHCCDLLQAFQSCLGISGQCAAANCTWRTRIHMKIQIVLMPNLHYWLHNIYWLEVESVRFLQGCKRTDKEHVECALMSMPVKEEHTFHLGRIPNWDSPILTQMIRFIIDFYFWVAETFIGVNLSDPYLSTVQMKKPLLLFFRPLRKAASIFMCSHLTGSFVVITAACIKTQGLPCVQVLQNCQESWEEAHF